jgi:adenylate cyclase
MLQSKQDASRRRSWPFDAKGLLELAAGIGLDARDSEETALRKRLAVALSAGTLPLTVLWSVIYLIAGAPLTAAIPGFYSVVTPINTLIFARTRNFSAYRLSQLLFILILPCLVTVSLGGFKQSSVVIIWAALCPIGALLFDELRRTLFWIGGFAGFISVTAAIQSYFLPTDLAEPLVTWFFVLNVGTVITVAFGLLYYFVGRKNFFQRRAETLLLNILPKDVSERLKTNQATVADHYDDTSVLFADIVEFTPLASKLSPLEVVDLLNEVFGCFDDLVEKYDLEKIKTIGDCYMVGSGVPRARLDHATALVDLALEMQAAASVRKFGGCRLSFRVGINSGPVVAGVIGHNKFVYDLWGETVNLASRMESHGQARCIQVTPSTYELIKEAFECTSMGLIEVKGAGIMEVWHVIGRIH